MTTDRASYSTATPGPSRYGRLLALGLLSFGAIYVLLFSMVDVVENVVPNLDQVYMAGLITAVLGVLAVAVMRDAYPNPRTNAIIVGVNALAAVVFFSLIRQQAGIDDERLMRSMIPHHAVAIHMCDRAQLQDPEIVEMCRQIVTTQRQEIERLKDELRAANP